MKTIGEVIEILEKANQDAWIWFDFGSVTPTTVNSWRGIYAEAALGFATDGGTVYVKDVLANLREAISGKMFTGYKGGDYFYRSSTPLHVDNYGHSSNTEIASIEVNDRFVIIKTQHEES